MDWSSSSRCVRPSAWPSASSCDSAPPWTCPPTRASAPHVRHPAAATALVGGHGGGRRGLRLPGARPGQGFADRRPAASGVGVAVRPAAQRAAGRPPRHPSGVAVGGAADRVAGLLRPARPPGPAGQPASLPVSAVVVAGLRGCSSSAASSDRPTHGGLRSGRCCSPSASGCCSASSPSSPSRHAPAERARRPRAAGHARRRTRWWRSASSRRCCSSPPSTPARCRRRCRRCSSSNPSSPCASAPSCSARNSTSDGYELIALALAVARDDRGDRSRSAAAKAPTRPSWRSRRPAPAA